MLGEVTVLDEDPECSIGLSLFNAFVVGETKYARGMFFYLNPNVNVSEIEAASPGSGAPEESKVVGMQMHCIHNYFCMDVT